MKFDAVIFDLDGTLADTLDDLAEATNVGLEQLGLPPVPVEKIKYMVGMGRTELCRRALPADHQHLVNRLAELLSAYYAEHWHDQTVLYPGIEDLLRRLAESGLPLAVLSNKPQDFVEVMVARMMGFVRFAVVQGDRPDVPRKPDPAGALAIAQTLAVPVERIA